MIEKNYGKSKREHKSKESPPQKKTGEKTERNRISKYLQNDGVYQFAFRSADYISVGMAFASLRLTHHALIAQQDSG